MIHSIDVKKIISSSIEVKQKILSDQPIIGLIQTISDELVNTFKNDGQLLLCGNGGSAADAQHIAAELSGRFYFDRPPLNAEALHVNTSYITAIANDYSFNDIYSRMVKAKGKKGDMIFAFSTSGKSQNILNALITANEMGMTTVGFTGLTGGTMKDYCKYLIKVPSNDTPRIQESHILLGHIISEIVEHKIFGQ